MNSRKLVRRCPVVVICWCWSGHRVNVVDLPLTGCLCIICPSGHCTRHRRVPSRYHLDVTGRSLCCWRKIECPGISTARNCMRYTTCCCCCFVRHRHRLRDPPLSQTQSPCPKGIRTCCSCPHESTTSSQRFLEDVVRWKVALSSPSKLIPTGLSSRANRLIFPAPATTFEVFRRW